MLFRSGSVEVIVFPRDYEKNLHRLNEDEKVFITGRTSMEDEKDGKLILESIQTFEEVGKEVWIKFANKDLYEQKKAILDSLIAYSEGKDQIVLFLEEEKLINRLPRNKNIKMNQELLQSLQSAFGEENIKVL